MGAVIAEEPNLAVYTLQAMHAMSAVAMPSGFERMQMDWGLH